jgi:hypothetical protein
MLEATSISANVSVKRRSSNVIWTTIASTVHRIMEREVSVRNVVPTLTSNKRQGLSHNGRC